MILIGLTGGVGMGKSTVADYLIRRGELLLDTDVLARSLVEPGESALEEIRQEFGREVFAADGILDRKALGAVVFQDERRRKVLERILHPRIRAAWRARVEEWRRAGARRAVVVIPLLYETGAETEVSKVICIACSPPVQRARLRLRAWSDDEIALRIQAQWPVSRKMDRADGVVWNESSLEMCEEQTARLFN